MDLLAIFSVAVLCARTILIDNNNAFRDFHRPIRDCGRPVSTTRRPVRQYTKLLLHSLRPDSSTHISPDVLCSLRDSNICTVSKTKRGKRGGKKKIRVIVSNRLPCETYTEGPSFSTHYTPLDTPKLNTANLISINTANVTVQSDHVIFGHQNCRSCMNKQSSINQLIVEENVDFMFLTETWIQKKKHAESITNPLKPPGYFLRSFPRKIRTGGGIAFIVREQYKPSILEVVELSFTSFEAVQLNISLSEKHFTVLCVYRPPRSKKNKIPDSVFLNEFCSAIDTLSTSYKNLIVIGDLNIHFDVTTESLPKHCLTILNERGLKQLITGPTQDSGHTLDVVITPHCDTIVKSFAVLDKHVSDHKFLKCELDFLKLPKVVRTVVSRNINSINLQSFKTDIGAKLSEAITDKKDLADHFYDVCLSVMDKHAPSKTRKVTERPHSPWFTLKEKQAKQERRKAERRYNKTGLQIHKDIFIYLKNKSNSLCDLAKSVYYNAKFQCVKSCKELYNLKNELFGKNYEPSLPSNAKPSDLPDLFSSYFFFQGRRY